MVPVEVSVHQITHRLRRDFLFDLGDQRRRGGGFRMRVDDDHVLRSDENRSVAIGERLGVRQGEVDSVSNFLDVEQTAAGGRRLSTSYGGAEKSQFQD